jgi:hypothetical protein
MAAFAGGLPGDRGKGALEKTVVHDVTLVIFPFNDPVAGIGSTLSRIGEDYCGLKALSRVDEKGSAGPKGVHESLFLTALFRRRRVFQHLRRKKCVTVFVDFHKGFWSLVCDVFGLLGTVKRIRWRNAS